MEKFFDLLVPDLSQLRSSRTTSPSRDEIRSPSFDFSRLNSRRFYQRKNLCETILNFDENPILIHELTEEDSDSRKNAAAIKSSHKSQTETDSSLTLFVISPVKERYHFLSSPSKDADNPAAQGKKKSNSSPRCRILEEFEICPIHRGTVHSSPKLVTSHFEDSGFLNCSMEMPSRLGLGSASELQGTSGKNNCRDSYVSSLNHRVLFDSHLEEGEANYSSILEDKEPIECSICDNPDHDKLPTTETDEHGTWLVQNRSNIITDDECERDASPEKFTNLISANKQSTSFVHKSNSICANNVSFRSKGNCIIFDSTTHGARHRSQSSEPSRCGGTHKKIANSDIKAFENLAASVVPEETKGDHLVNGSEDIFLIKSLGDNLSGNGKKISDIIIFK